MMTFLLWVVILYLQSFSMGLAGDLDTLPGQLAQAFRYHFSRGKTEAWTEPKQPVFDSSDQL